MGELINLDEYREKKEHTKEEIRFFLGQAAYHGVRAEEFQRLADEELAHRRAILARIGMLSPDFSDDIA